MSQSIISDEIDWLIVPASSIINLNDSSLLKIEAFASVLEY